jgi:hypothetical protein
MFTEMSGTSISSDSLFCFEHTASVVAACACLLTGYKSRGAGEEIEIVHRSGDFFVAFEGAPVRTLSILPLK